MGYDRGKDVGALRLSSANDTARQTNNGNSLQAAQRPITSMADTTVAPNRLPAPPATAGSTMGSKPGRANINSPGTKQTGVGPR